MVQKDDNYYTHNNGSNQMYSIENGMTKQQLEAITAEQWVELETILVFTYFLHVVIILQSEETGVGDKEKITVNFKSP